MANTNITSTQATGFIPEIWLAVALGRLKNYITISRCVTRDTEVDKDKVFTVGSTLALPKRGALVVNDKVENNNLTVQNPTATDITLTLSKHKEVTFGVESRALSVSNQNFIAGYVEDAVIAIAEQIDSDLLAYIGTLTTNPVIVGGASLTEANILAARKVLVDNKAGALTKKFGIVPTSQTNALLQIDRLTRFDALGVSNDISDGMVGSAVRTMEGSIGKVHSIELCESQLMPFAGTYLSPFFSKDAILFASRELETPEEGQGVIATAMMDKETGIVMRLMKSYQHLQTAHVISLDVLYGYTAQRPEHVQNVSTTA